MIAQRLIDLIVGAGLNQNETQPKRAYRLLRITFLQRDIRIFRIQKHSKDFGVSNKLMQQLCPLRSGGIIAIAVLRYPTLPPCCCHAAAQRSDEQVPRNNGSSRLPQASGLHVREGGDAGAAPQCPSAQVR